VNGVGEVLGVGGGGGGGGSSRFILAVQSLVISICTTNVTTK